MAEYLATLGCVERCCRDKIGEPLVVEDGIIEEIYRKNQYYSIIQQTYQMVHKGNYVEYYSSQLDVQEPTDISKQPIRASYLGHVTGYQPIRDQYFMVRSVPVDVSMVCRKIYTNHYRLVT